MTAATVDVRSLTKSYGRERARGVVDVTLCIDPGEVMGLVGANGAGKTTLMRTMLDFIRPTRGTVQLFGLDSRAGALAIRRRTSYLPGELVFPARLTGRDVVARYLSARAVEPGDIERLAGDLDLDLGRRVGDLSKGNKQKLGLLLAFAPRTDLLVLDEPTSGLDPLLQRQFADLVVDVTRRGAAVLLSSHVMAEVEQVAHSVALMRDGRVVTVEPLDAILAKGTRRGQARPHDRADLARLADALSATCGIGEITVGEGTGQAVVRFVLSGDVNPLLAVLAGYRLDGFDLAHADLEDSFFRTEGGAS
jgi:ABC-2 type transport system ATP-binding protein